MDPKFIEEYDIANEQYMYIYNKFATNCLMVDKKNSIRLQNVYHVFRTWCEKNVSGSPPSRREMKEHLERIIGRCSSQNKCSSNSEWNGWSLVTPTN